MLIPTEESPLPIFGCELHFISPGVHLVVLDAFATCEIEEASRLRSTLERLGASLAGAFELRPPPDWSEKVFSDRAIVIEPESRSLSELGAVVPVINRLSSAFLAAATQDVHAHASMHDEIRAARARYLKAHAEQDSAGLFLERMAGKKWVDGFIDEVLFPSWLA